MDAIQKAPARNPAFITLFADASHCRLTRAGGWGAWAKRDGWKFGKTFGGLIERDCSDSFVAELWAIALALDHLNTDAAIDGGASIIIQSDCLRALENIAGRIPRVAISHHQDGAKFEGRMLDLLSTEGDALGVINQVRSARDLRLTLRHVRGHRAGGNRQWVNRQCDLEARKHMRAARIKAIERSAAERTKSLAT